ncbi:MAG: acylase [Alphaproteobacteria bacterium]|nr:acylase [Alphaproteobacteria bacterium]MBV9694575.1 acylase [Alphaproteobacteria bacterium]
MRLVRIGAAVMIALVLAGVVALIVADRLGRPSPPDPATLIAKARSYHARIVRDDFGVPHIFGHRDADVAFGLGYAHSEDDFATIQDVALATRGGLAASEGVKAAAGDYLVHAMRVWETVDRRYARDLPGDVRQVLEGYADGVNYYAALHPGTVKPELLPLTGKDIAAGFVFKTPLFYGLGDTLKRLTADTDGKAPLPIGSNGIAVAPSRASDGATRLLVNSHQPYVGPVSWYEAVLQSDEGWHVAGGFFPGSPFMLHGHNEHLGWANTVNAPDLVDIYRLTINPVNPNQYRLDGRWRDLEVEDAAIRVKIFGPIVWTVHRPVQFSVHGPVFRTDHGVFAVRYAGQGEMRQVLEYFRLNKARNLDEWKAAMRLQALPSINYVYADEKGNIGYVYNGEFPVRRPGLDWQGYLPGERSDLIPRAIVPFDKLPQLWNPKSGFVFNSNNTPFQATAPEDDLKPSDYPSWMGIQTNMTNRALRVLETFGADPKIGADAFRRYKFDVRYSAKSDVAHLLAALCKDPPSDVVRACAVLHVWNLSADIHNRGAALAILTAQPVLRAREQHEPVPRPLDMLRQAQQTLKAHFGRIDPEWGEVNRFRRGAVDLPIDGGPDTYRAVYGVPQTDGTLTAVDGDTLIMFVTWDRDGKLSSDSIHQFGSATLDSHSRHYADQAPLFVAMKTKPVRFTWAALQGHIEADYAPGARP